MRPRAQFARDAGRTVDAEKVCAPYFTKPRWLGGEAAKGDRQLGTPRGGFAPDSRAQSFAIPRHILRVAAPIAAQHEIEHGVERVHFDLEVTFAVTDGIEEDLDDFLGVKRRIARGERRADVRVLRVKEHAHFPGIPRRAHARGLHRRGSGDDIAQQHGLALFPKGRPRIGSERRQYESPAREARQRFGESHRALFTAGISARRRKRPQRRKR